MKSKPNEYMTPEEGQKHMRRWAAEQNAITRHNLGAYQEEVTKHAEAVGIVWRAPGGMQTATRAFFKDAERARRQWLALKRAGEAHRGQYKAPPEALREAFATWRGKVKHRTQACRQVAREFGVSTETVRKYTKDQEW